MMILRDLSLLWSMIHTLILFLLIFPSRYSNRKTLFLSLITMLPLIVLNLLLFIIFEAADYAFIMLLLLSLPSMIVFWILSKYRDGRFFFTFCMVDTVSLELIYITNIIHHYLPTDNYIDLFLMRLVIYPLIEIWAFRKLRPLFLSVQKSVKTGWGRFAVIGLLFYIAITLLMNRPTIITERPEYLPVLTLLFILMPVIYIHIIITLRNQQELYAIKERENIFLLQTNNLSQYIKEIKNTNEAFREERHNFRHKLHTILELVEKEKYEELPRLLAEYSEKIDKTKVIKYCQNPILDATLSFYLNKAYDTDIDLDISLQFPQELSISDIELATVLANAIENAIHACEKIEKGKRFLQLKVVCKPIFSIAICNSFDGNVLFDKAGLPISNEVGHGFGTRSIAAFCERVGAYYQFSADGERFCLYMNFN